MKILLHFFLFALFATVARANCPVHGCTPSCSYSSDAEFITAGYQPKLLWSTSSREGARPSGVGCVTNTARIVCPMTGGGRSYLVSWDTVDNGQTPWNISLKGVLPLPVMDAGGDVFASDGLSLVGCQGDGTPFGKPIRLFPVNGELFDISLVESAMFVLLYKCGFFVAYTFDGVAFASVWLNDTVDGENGTFIPLNSPASQGERLYILGAFKAETETSLRLRLFAIDIRRSVVQRIKIAWYYDFTIEGVSFPYLSSSETVCTLHPPPELDHTTARPLAHIAVNAGLVTVVFNYNVPSSWCSAEGCHSSRPYMSRMLVVQDKGSDYVLSYTQDSMHLFQALGFASSQTVAFWRAMFDLEAKQSVLQQVSYSTGHVVSNISIAHLLGTGSQQVNITSQLAFLHQSTTGSSELLVVCVLVENVKSLVVAVEVKTSKLVWSVDLGTEPCVGQISSVDGARSSMLVVTSSAEVSVFSLTDTS